MSKQLRASDFEQLFRRQFPLFPTSSVPNIASAKKNMRKSRAAAVRNRAQRSTLRTAVKKARSSDASTTDRTRAVQLLDRAARKGLIHKNNAARHKSQLTRKGQ